ncbi:MAG: hypothetical protein ACKVT2_21300 [Saprospiraceae bacterium]
MSASKEKRTKEQVIRLLDRAIEQEETLLENIKSLEAELSECRKKAENPRYELDEQSTPGSKISFRIDFYRTEKNGSLKGIIEHLQTRENKSFDGGKLDEISCFLAPYLGSEALGESPKPSSQNNPPLVIAQTAPNEENGEYSPLLRKLFPERFGAKPNLPSIPEPAAPGSAAVRLSAGPFSILTPEQTDHHRSLHKYQGFQIEIPIKGLKEFEGNLCRIKVAVESDKFNNSQTFETSEFCTPGQAAMRISVPGLPLDQGVYRLVVFITPQEEPHKAYYRESRILIVK